MPIVITPLWEGLEVVVGSQTCGTTFGRALQGARARNSANYRVDRGLFVNLRGELSCQHPEERHGEKF